MNKDNKFFDQADLDHRYSSESSDTDDSPVKFDKRSAEDLYQSLGKSIDTDDVHGEWQRLSASFVKSSMAVKPGYNYQLNLSVWVNNSCFHNLTLF